MQQKQDKQKYGIHAVILIYLHLRIVKGNKKQNNGLFNTF